MTEKRKIDMLRTLIDDREEDEGVLSVYLELAAEKIINRLYPLGNAPADFKVPDRYSMKQVNISCYLYEKAGAEGEIQHIENGIHRNYGSADVPDAMLSDIVPFCQAIR